MWSTWYIKSRADFKRRWLQASILAVVLMAGAASITLAFTVDRSTLRVIEGLHEDANSAHAWLYGDPTALTQASEQAEVEQAGQVFVTLSGELIHNGEVHEASIWGLDAVPDVSPGLLTDGRWSNPDASDEVVIGSGLASQIDVEIGDRVLLVSPNSRAAGYEVVGIVTPTFRVPYPQQALAAVFTSAQTIDDLTGVETTDLSANERLTLGLDFGIGVRLVSPDTTEQFVDGLAGIRANTWEEIREGIVQESAGPTTMLIVFALFAVLASGFVVTAVITNHALAQKREIGLLKAVGFTPRQTATLLLTQMLAITIPAALIGIAIGVLTTPLFQWGVTDLLNSPATRSVNILTLVGVFLAAQVLVIVCAALPALRVGRTQIVDAIAMAPRQAGTGASMIARGTDSLRLPQVVVVGVKDAFTRPLRSWMILAAIGVAAATLMMTFSFRHSLQRITDDPALIGSKPYELQVTRLNDLTPARPGGIEIPTTMISAGDAEAIVAAQPGVAEYVTDRTSTLVASGVEVLTHATGGNIQAMGFEMAAGRLFIAPNEAVVGLGLAQELNLEVGDQFDVEILPGQMVTLDIVGTFYADENEGNVLMYGLDRLRALEPGIEPENINVVLTDDADIDTVAAEIITASDGRLVITDLTREADANISEGRRLIAPMTLLGTGLAVLAAANLLGSLIFSVRERRSEFGILKAIGFKPWQIVSIVMVGVAPLALLGTLIGAPIGYWLIDLLMRSQAEAHQPGDIIVVPGAPWLVALVAIMLLISLIGAFVPALRAGQLGVSEALRTE